MLKQSIDVTVNIKSGEYGKGYTSMVQKAVFRALIGILIICDSLELINGSTINEIFRWNCTIVVYFTIFLLFHAFFSKFILRRQFESNKRLQKETIYQFANDNIKCIFSDGSGELYYKWDELYAAELKTNYFILYTGRYDIIIIPKRSIGDEQMSELNKLINDKLGTKVFSSAWIKIRRVITGIIIIVNIVVDYILNY